MSSWNAISKLATFNLAFFSIPRQFAKLNSSPNFPAIWVYRWFPNVNLSVLLPEGKRVIKKQLYSEPLTLREAASSIFQQ